VIVDFVTDVGGSQVIGSVTVRVNVVYASVIGDDVDVAAVIVT
jgi:hypothetical protein